jgi:hypothetical protein
MQHGSITCRMFSTTVTAMMINILDQSTFSKNCKKELSRYMFSSHRGWKIYTCPTPALEGIGWSAPSSGHFTPDKGTRYTSYRRLDEPRGRSGWVRIISPAGVRILDRPAGSEWLQRLRYPGCH